MARRVGDRELSVPVPHLGGRDVGHPGPRHGPRLRRFHPHPRLGLARFETAVRREITKRGGQKPCLRIVRKLFAALTDPTGVIAHRHGALERVQLLLADWADNQRKLADTETRMVAVLDQLELTALVTSISGISAVGAAAILAEAGDPRRFTTARAMVKHAGLAPREKLSEELVEKRHSLVQRMYQAGIRLVGGADAGIGPNKAHGLYAESVIELAAATGVVDSLAASTSTAAQVCGVGERKGRLVTGYDADLLVVAGDLARDLIGLRQVRQVVLRGQPVG